MQLGLSDSNMAQLAEYLKIGTTALVVDMAQAGRLADAPLLRRPVRALHRFIEDPGLEASAPVRGGGSWTALRIQRWYLDRAREYVQQSPTAPLQAGEIVRLWADVLDALESEPAQLVGRLDWVSKRHLLSEALPTDTLAVRKKIDLRYHELGDGYFARLEQEGLAPQLLTEEQVRNAMRDPPDAGRAPARSRLIRDLGGVADVKMSWEVAVVPKRDRRGGANVIDLRKVRDPSDG